MSYFTCYSVLYKHILVWIGCISNNATIATSYFQSTQSQWLKICLCDYSVIEMSIFQQKSLYHYKYVFISARFRCDDAWLWVCVHVQFTHWLLSRKERGAGEGEVREGEELTGEPCLHFTCHIFVTPAHVTHHTLYHVYMSQTSHYIRYAYDVHMFRVALLSGTSLIP